MKLPAKGHGYSLDKKSIEIDPDTIASYDCILISSDHDFYKEELNYNNLIQYSQLIVDTRNMFHMNEISNNRLFRA